MSSAAAGGQLVVARQDYLPFGEEVPGAVGMRAGVAGYGQATGTRQKYAGMEGDEATGLSHTPWREFDSLSGRWTAPDPYSGSMELSSPQSFNRYSYVNNDPINKVDPTGLMLSDIGVEQVNGSGEASRLNYLSVHNFRYSVSEEYKRNYDNWQEVKQQKQQRQQQRNAAFAGGMAASAAARFTNNFFGSSPAGANESGPPDNQQQRLACNEQDFNFSGGQGGFSAQELGEIAQTAVGEASNSFYGGEVELVISTIVNRLNINATYAEQNAGYFPFNGGMSVLGILQANYDAHKSRSGERKLNQAKSLNGGVLAADSYVCDQLRAAKNFAIQAGHYEANDLFKLYPYTWNMGKGLPLPKDAVDVMPVGDTRFFNRPFR